MVIIMLTNILIAVFYMEILLFFMICVIIAVGFFDVLKPNG